MSVNLLNAKKDGQIQLGFEVKDTGIGIPADQQEKVFEEFYQLQNPERDRRKGLGLGCAQSLAREGVNVVIVARGAEALEAAAVELRQFGSTILAEASRSFLGLGIPEPYPSWGRMLSESAAEYVRTAPWLVIFPGVAISLAVFGTNLFGDALRDILDPRQRG